MGRPAPELSLLAPFGLPLESADLRGAPAVLLFVPGAFTPVCTQEVVTHAALDLGSARLVVVSCDSAPVLDAWRASLGLPDVEVASDFWPHGEVARAFDAFHPHRGTARRRTVLMDEDGVVRWIADSAGGVARTPEHLALAVDALRAGATGVDAATDGNVTT
ncbi:redoxin domain-containing protein [Salana multivorans]|uniref:redoxin domain-containing protein n=1 Tax=Salana multivorans TaxID=120377 RepID=UPI0024832650|nr:redoxin domain-containing protein [Salana multivorans]